MLVVMEIQYAAADPPAQPPSFVFLAARFLEGAFTLAHEAGRARGEFSGVLASYVPVKQLPPAHWRYMVVTFKIPNSIQIADSLLDYLAGQFQVFAETSRTAVAAREEMGLGREQILLHFQPVQAARV